MGFGIVAWPSRCPGLHANAEDRHRDEHAEQRRPGDFKPTEQKQMLLSVGSDNVSFFLHGVPVDGMWRCAKCSMRQAPAGAVIRKGGEWNFAEVHDQRSWRYVDLRDHSLIDCHPKQAPGLWRRMLRLLEEPPDLDREDFDG